MLGNVDLTEHLRPLPELLHQVSIPVGKDGLHPQVMFLQPVDQRDGEPVEDIIVFRHHDESEVRVDSALDSVGAQAQVHVAVTTHPGVALVQAVVEGLVQTLQVDKNHVLASLHEDLDPVDVVTDGGIFLISRKR